MSYYNQQQEEPETMEKDVRAFIENTIATTLTRMFVQPDTSSTPHDMNPNLSMAMSVDEVAKELGVAKTMVYRMVRANEIPHRKIGSRIVVGRAALEEWLSGKQ